MVVLELIQLKMHCLWPCHYARLTKDGFILLNAVLPPTSAPYRPMVGTFVKDSPLSLCGEHGPEQISALDGLPYRFILECMVSAKAHAGALKCRSSSAASCIDAADHKVSDDCTVFCWCTYHEHDDDRHEESLCGSKWYHSWHNYCVVTPLAQQQRQSLNVSS